MVMLVALTEDDDDADNVGQCWSINPACEKPETPNLIARHVLAFHTDVLGSSSRDPAPQTFK